MPLVKAWKCPHTNTLFDFNDRSSYKKHLSVLAYERKKERERIKEDNEWDSFLATAKDTLSTPDEIIKWFLKNQKRIISRYYRNDHARSYETFKITSLRTNAIRKERCSNSHSSPRSGVQNWISDPDKPTGYPGFHGTIAGEVIGRTESSCFIDSGMLRMVDVHTGSGGGGERFSYSVTIFEDDWPKMKEARFEQTIQGSLSSK